LYRDLIWPRGSGASAPPGTMARIPAGPFKLGSGQEAQLDAFAIDVHEVTNAQYGEFIDAGGYTKHEFWSEAGWEWLQNKGRQQPAYWDNEQLNGPTQPVVGVTWYEAEAYCAWAGKMLPTEQQWEKACRGDDGRRFPWGNEPLPPSAASSGDSSHFVPAAVGGSPQTQSPYGVHDLVGNVLEWTRTTRADRQIVLCGGSGSHRSQTVDCGRRHTLLPGISANFIGFRCQATVP
jgi:formylglycine-generating enzyme required for sulfatase activity